MARTQVLLETLNRQHAVVRELVAEVSRATDGVRRQAVDRLLRYLALHEAAEQAVMHPTGLLNAADVDVVEGRIAEEHEIHALITRLEECPPGSVDFMIYFGLLDEALSAHLRAEEEVEAPVLTSSLGEDELRHLAATLALVDSWSDSSAPIPPPLAGDIGAGRRSGTRFSDRFQRAVRTFEDMFQRR